MAISWDTLKKTRDVKKIDTEIHELQVQISELNSSRKVLTEQIADNWGDDTSKLEAEYSGIDAKLAGAKNALEKLQWMRADVAKHATVNDYKKELKQLDSELKERKKLQDQRQKLKDQLEDIDNSIRTANTTLGSIEEQLSRLIGQAAKQGLSAVEQEALEAERVKIIKKIS